MGKFVRGVLPKLLENMKSCYGWSDLPRTVVHDKGSYMITPAHDRLQVSFAASLREGGFHSWIGSESQSAVWLVKKFGDVYPHETAIAHIRRLLDSDFASTKLHESPQQFIKRMQRVEDFMNSDSFAAAGGSGLLGLAKSLRSRCKALIQRKGQRLPK